VSDDDAVVLRLACSIQCARAFRNKNEGSGGLLDFVSKGQRYSQVIARHPGDLHSAAGHRCLTWGACVHLHGKLTRKDRKFLDEMLVLKVTP